MKDSRRSPWQRLSRPQWLAIAGGLLALAAVIAFASRPTAYRLQDAGRRAYAHVVIALRMPNVAHIHRDITYCKTQPAQLLDLYVPKAGPGPYPIIVFIHGGGWYSGNKDDPIVGAYGPSLVKQGFALASIDYSLVPKHYPVQNQQVDCALSYLYNNAGRYNLNNHRFGLFGASAGGELALYAALADSSRAQPWWPSVRGVVDFYGITDLTAPPPTSHLGRVIRNYLGPSWQSEITTASPITYANQSAPPVLIYQGNHDHHVPLTQSQQLVATLTQNGNSAQLVVVQHAGHGFGAKKDRPSVSQIRQNVIKFFANAFSHAG